LRVLRVGGWRLFLGCRHVELHGHADLDVGRDRLGFEEALTVVAFKTFKTRF
jgi:hypothetical protein